VKSAKRIKKAVVLAAGKGVRLWPLTENRSKHMIPIAGRPLLEHLILAIKKSGIRSFALVTGYGKELLKRHLGDGSSYGVKIEYVHQSDISGTASAISVARHQVGDEDFLLVYGDLVTTSAAIRSVLDKHRRTGGRMTVGLVPVTDPSSFGIARIDDRWLTEIVEKPGPSASPSNLANAGVYALSPVLFDHLRAASKTERGEFEITDAISSLARAGQQIAWARIEASDWLDIGRPWDLLTANARLLTLSTRSIRGTVQKGATVTGRVTIQGGATIKTGTVIQGPAWIGRDAVVGPFAHIRPGVSIGAGSVIGNFCEIKNSIIMARTHIQHLSYVGDSIIGENCNFGAGTVVANVKLSGRTVRMKIRDKLEDSGLRKLGVITGDNVKTGINASIMPGIRLTSGAVVPAASVAAEDIVSV
jgi:bifunctional UDP-N-acetylglucosamine pyrophosphorylase/glucosamine-1-phosphate N-acetyltransferase